MPRITRYKPILGYYFGQKTLVSAEKLEEPGGADPASDGGGPGLAALATPEDGSDEAFPDRN